MGLKVKNTPQSHNTVIVLYKKKRLKKKGQTALLTLITSYIKALACFSFPVFFLALLCFNMKTLCCFFILK